MLSGGSSAAGIRVISERSGVSITFNVQWTPTVSTYVNYDGQLGRDRYDSNVTGGVRISF
jgi:outer membrane autotransporter protein